MNRYASLPRFSDKTVTEIAVPSGKIIAADDLRRTPHFDIEPPLSINYGKGLDAYAKLFAREANTAYAFVGNSCPSITRQVDGTLTVVCPDYDEDGDGNVFVEQETLVANICTDLWATMLTDYQHWLDHGGAEVESANAPYALQKYTVFDVAPGTYRWTVHSHDDTFDIHADGRVVYAQLELIEAGGAQ